LTKAQLSQSFDSLVMPLMTLHLIRLHLDADIKKFLRALGEDRELNLVVASQPRFLVIRPTRVDVNPLTAKAWDLMLLLSSPDNAIPTPLRPAICEEYKIHVGVPSKVLSTYRQRNQSLIRNASQIPLTGALDKAQARDSSQSLELSPDLIAFMNELSKEHDKPVTMLNLLNFQHGGKTKYYQYGQVCLLNGPAGSSGRLTKAVSTYAGICPGSRQARR